MPAYPVRTHPLVHRLYPQLTWTTETEEVAITFDDGPHPEITPWILELLSEVNITASFFMVGANVEKYPDIVQMVADHGHTIGGHTTHHLDLWKSSRSEYLQDAIFTQNLLNTKCFRPPYGRINKKTAKALLASPQIENIYMWSLLTADFDRKISPKQCFDLVKRKLKKGDIVVFHDSDKARERIEYALPATIDLILKNNMNTTCLDS